MGKNHCCLKTLFNQNQEPVLGIVVIFSGYMKDGKFTLYVQDGIFCHFLASMFSGLVTTIASMPVDIAKTR